MRCITSTVCIVASVLLSVAHSVGADHRVGVAAVDITPDYPVRLSGFGFRRTESEGVTQRIWAKALAFADDQRGPAVLLTVDNLAIPAYMTKEVGRRLKEKATLDAARLAVTCTHTHTAPMLTNVAPTLFGMPIPPEHQRNIDRYTRELTDALERVSLAALADLKPARLEFGTGTVDLAANRRTKGGPVDHDLPLLAVKNPEGKIRALYLSYACHCVTLSNNHVSGDWAGYAQEAIERDHPGAIALVSIGCGADSNPKSGVTGDKVEVAKSQGAQIADQVERLLKSDLTPITEPIVTKLDSIELLFDTHPTPEEWQEKAKRNDAIGHHARVQLARLDRGEKLQAHLTYPVQTWVFGDRLAMVFLPGEVVVDYSLRLKREFDRSRLWVNAYSNDNPCYIPSERILKEGGYEGGGAMVYYDRPGRLAPGLEQKIIDEVSRQLPPGFRSAAAPAAAAEGPARDPAAVAKVVLDANRPEAEREAAVKENPDIAAELIAEMTRDMKAGTKEEYERIPWIWRVAVACGRRNDANQMRRVLDAALPKADEPLRDWQAVVIGGGIITGISDGGHWPGTRVEEILTWADELLRRYRRALVLASAMADDEKVPTPTRYDALRMLGVTRWEGGGAQLVKYLAKGVHPELQQGAVSALGDMGGSAATEALIDAMAELTEENRTVAVDALSRDADRAEMLLDAVANGKVRRDWIEEARAKKLREHSDAKVRERAGRVLK